MLAVKQLLRSGPPGPTLTTSDFTVADGECVAVTGPSGAGKSLLLRAIADLDPNQGEVCTDQLIRSQVPAPQWRRAVTYLAAESGWWAETVAEHFLDPAAARAHLSDLRLPADCLDWPVSRLSSGERQRLALLRALLQKPQVLLLDEPTAALDPASVTAVEQLLRAELRRGVSILLVSHDEHQVERLARRRLQVESGMVREL